jgi:hypothetical protein
MVWGFTSSWTATPKGNTRAAFLLQSFVADGKDRCTRNPHLSAPLLWFSGWKRAFGVQGVKPFFE